MESFWDLFIEPILRLRRPLCTVEIGAEHGYTTRRLLDFCRQHGGVVRSIEPVPQLELFALQNQYPGVYFIDKGLSLNLIPTLPPFQLILIDGDHNWYTVYNELKLIEKRSRELGQPFPLCLFHDVGWPYGRRDLYYSPETIPEEFRQPFAKKGMAPGKSELLEQGGINSFLCNALQEYGPRNGVLTGVEDFQKEAGFPLELAVVPGYHGFAALFSPDLEGDPQLVPFLRSMRISESVKVLLQRLDNNRVVLHQQLFAATRR